MLLLDVTHTSHTRAQTGIQRVCRSLAAELTRKAGVRPVCFDPHQHAWRDLGAAERATLADRSGDAASRGAKWTLGQKLLGRARRLTGKKSPMPAGRMLLCPELFSAHAATRLPELFAAVGGPRAAIFHDAIGLKFPELTPPATVARLPCYLRELAQFDGVAAVSEDSAASLRDFWRWAELKDVPPVVAIPLGVDPVPGAGPEADTSPPRVLCVSTMEGRKNHAALLEAAETLWHDGVRFELELIGLPRADTGAANMERIRGLQGRGRPLVYHGAVSEGKLHAAYARCAFTVYPSLCEGFGLPVIESLQHGKPCIASRGGALAEVAQGGGVVSLEAADPSALAGAMRRLLAHPRELAALAAAARARQFRSWGDYASELLSWLAALPRRS
ncbi:MAG: glycosyltransferase family 1 protein [Opitutus sp.]|nr:glycosyltransferase family 1 protein [Opitutus sp.]